MSVTSINRSDSPELNDSPELVFTLARGQNRFFVELAEALVYELERLNVSACIEMSGGFPLPHDRRVHVFLPPHEYVALSGHRLPPRLLRRSIVISAEQPKSEFFAANVALARDAGAVFDINRRAVRAYASSDVQTEHLQMGYTEPWDRFVAGVEKDIDVLFLGRLTPRRATALASYAGVLERFRCHIGLSDNSRPNVSSGATFVAGERKLDLLARAKVLINIHGEDEPYFEWLRAAEAICAGCVMVSERSTDLEPLQWGRHIVTGGVGALGLLCASLIDDSERRERIRVDAYELLRDEHPLSGAARRLASAARRIAAVPLDELSMLAGRLERARQSTSKQPHALLQPLERTDISVGEGLALRALKAQQLALTSLRRQVAALQRSQLGEETGESTTTVLVADSPAWSSGQHARLTVITPLFNHRDEVLDALASVERSVRADWEVVVVDDASTDGGGEAVRQWIETHPERACRLVRHELNRGLAVARNTGVQQARTGRLLMLDADNEVRPVALARLMDALDADPKASFAYGIMEQFTSDGSVGLLSSFGWDPERLRIGNYIDAFSLIRAEELLALGGYSSDPRLYGWEDYDLWARMAESGRHAAFVPEIIGRYRVAHSSMISQTNMSTSDAYAATAEHAPRLLSGLRIPR
ncbi:MAG: glycosyltransferase [Solirubrobacterales bacterium]